MFLHNPGTFFSVLAEPILTIFIFADSSHWNEKIMKNQTKLKSVERGLSDRYRNMVDF